MNGAHPEPPATEAAAAPPTPWGPVEDRLLFAVIASGGGPLTAELRAALGAPGLPPLSLDEELRLRAALQRARPEGLRPADAPTPPAPARPAAQARAVLLGLRLGPAAENTAAAVCARWGATAAELLHLRLRMQVAAAEAPLAGLDPAGLDAAALELTRPPPWLEAAVQGLGGPLPGAPSPRRRRAAGISPARYRHPHDAAATAALGRSVAFVEVARRLSEALPERVLRLENNASRVRVGPDQLPRLYATFQGCVRRLGVSPEPALYVGPGALNAWTAGVEQPFVVITEGALASLSEPELCFVLGHELGHILHEHMLYMMVAQLLRVPGSALGSIPFIGGLLTKGLDLMLFEWMRKAELSCDRAGLLCAQDEEVALRLMMRMAGLPPGLAATADIGAFLSQHDALQGQLDELTSRLYYLMSTANRSHPWAVVRAHQLRSWVQTGALEALLAECPLEPAAAAAPTVRRCAACGAPAEAADRFCAACGAPLNDAVEAL